MAVSAMPKDSVLVVSYQTGLNEMGAPILRTRSFGNVAVNAADTDIFDVAVALYALQNYTLTGVRRDNRFDLVAE